MDETIDRLLSMSSVTSVSADSNISRSKEKYKIVHYEGWEAYQKILEDKGVSKNMINTMQTLIEYMNSLYGKDDIKITYAQSAVNIRNLHSNNVPFTLQKDWHTLW